MWDVQNTCPLEIRACRGLGSSFSCDSVGNYGNEARPMLLGHRCCLITPGISPHTSGARTSFCSVLPTLSVPLYKREGWFVCAGVHSLLNDAVWLGTSPELP